MPEFPPIENHAMVGDLHTIALVALDGTVDFMCFPRFDSPSIFASLLDPEKGGHFKLQPELDGATRKQLYLPDSNILLTRFLAHAGVAEVSDFMPVGGAGHAHNLVRRIKAVRGEVSCRVECAPRFDYGRAEHTCERDSDGVTFSSKGAMDGAAAAQLGGAESRKAPRWRPSRCASARSASFVLEDARARLACNTDRYVAESFKETMNYWRSWVAQCRYTGRWREMVHRSALTLKLLRLAGIRFAGGRADFWLAGSARRRAQLGLPLHLDSRCLLHDLRADAARLHGGSGGL